MLETSLFATQPKYPDVRLIFTVDLEMYRPVSVTQFLCPLQLLTNVVLLFGPDINRSHGSSQLDASNMDNITLSQPASKLRCMKRLMKW